jgi:hypothetical protein
MPHFGPYRRVRGLPDCADLASLQPRSARTSKNDVGTITRSADPAFQVVVLPSWQLWMTGAVVYNDTFWALDCVGLRTGS